MNREQTTESGFSLVEVLIVLAIFSLLSVMMVYSTTNARQIGTATQNLSTANQNGRLVLNILERDSRLIGSGIYEEIYFGINGGKADDASAAPPPPDGFNYELTAANMDSFMVPPIEVTNGTDTTSKSYLMPVEGTFGITSAYREPNTDLVTIYYSVDNGFDGTINEFEGLGQENFVVNDPVRGQRIKNIFDQMGGNPVLVLILDNNGEYATFRTVTQIAVNNDEYRVKMEPSNDFNQPSNFKDFIKDVFGNLSPEEQKDKIRNDTFFQVSAVTYFVYSHPDPAEQAQGWLVRLDLGSITSSGTPIDATDPDTIRPYVIAENVSDFQVAFALDSDQNDIIDASEWINDESMELYIHDTLGEEATAEYLNFVNDLRAFRFSIVSHTDSSSEYDPYAFPDPSESSFSSQFPGVAEVAEKIGVSPTLEDRTWNYTELIDRLWYRKAVQYTKSVVIRNLDLDNTFARVQ